MAIKLTPGRAEINGRLMEVIRERGLNMTAVGDITDTPTGTISDWYHKGAVPDAEKLARFGRGTGANLHWLLTGDGPRTAPGHGELLTDDAIRMGRKEVLEMIKSAVASIETRLAGRRRRRKAS
jgi:CI repressor-like protein